MNYESLVSGYIPEELNDNCSSHYSCDHCLVQKLVKKAGYIAVATLVTSLNLKVEKSYCSSVIKWNNEIFNNREKLKAILE
jgi:hypothetical protein